MAHPNNVGTFAQAAVPDPFQMVVFNPARVTPHVLRQQAAQIKARKQTIDNKILSYQDRSHKYESDLERLAYAISKQESRAFARGINRLPQELRDEVWKGYWLKKVSPVDEGKNSRPVCWIDWSRQLGLLKMVVNQALGVFHGGAYYPCPRPGRCKCFDLKELPDEFPTVVLPKYVGHIAAYNAVRAGLETMCDASYENSDFWEPPNVIFVEDLGNHLTVDICHVGVTLADTLSEIHISYRKPPTFSTIGKTRDWQIRVEAQRFHALRSLRRTSKVVLHFKFPYDQHHTGSLRNQHDGVCILMAFKDIYWYLIGEGATVQIFDSRGPVMMPYDQSEQCTPPSVSWEEEGMD